MERRSPNSSDESTQSTVSSIVRNAQIVQRFLDATELAMMPDSTILERSFSLKSVISTTSSFSRRFQEARSRPDLQDIHQIGIGLQGVVFEQVGKDSVFKKEKPGNESRPSNLRHEYKIHLNVSAAFERYQRMAKIEVTIPKPIEYIQTAQQSSFWDDVFPKIPLEYRTRGDIMKMQRILPLPKIVRRALIAHLCGQERYLETPETKGLLDNPQNKHCLTRIYLGKANGPYHPEAPLRNFPLYLGTMKKLGIETTRLATAMGKSYATLHWGSGVNGDDVEFVFGTFALEMRKGQLRPDFQRRAIGLFLLDFGQCESVDLSENPQTVYQAFKGAMVMGDNQSFIPHLSNDPELFAAFKKGYIEVGNVILLDKRLNDAFSVEDFMQQYEEYAADFLC
ncbi:hypothetical protein N7537_001873 [Penicillium hordei]|uniref:Uncharacterized protein n=1 Tax=Penicillium hordei TaxID=40994 RepID=A0AAD6EG95_9EURO|nr:uncharacterized protein N7537_001873 [Penicillium hordei]KAJ5616759.1 hypothetical protein N7537_001873 [Penicillium hordei]